MATRQRMARRFYRWLAGALAAALVALGAGSPSAREITLGEAAWSDAQLVTALAAHILEKRGGHHVVVRTDGIAQQYARLATGELDGALMLWLPDTHSQYIAKYGDRLTQLGMVYGDARLGWVVPAYVDKSAIESIADLADPAVRRKLGGKIVGIDPGAGLMDHSKSALQAYGLDGYKLVSGSESDMLAALQRAIDTRKPIVVTAWSPHWMFGAYNLRYLADPKRALGERERVHAAVRQGFYRAAPEVTGFLDRLYLPISKLESLLFAAEQVGEGKAVKRFVADNPDLVDYWLTGRMK